jgi:hypothetical protein
MSRDEFTPAQKQKILELNAENVRLRWPSDFTGQPPHYMCEHCYFVSDTRKYFQIDHIFPCKEGGKADRMREDQIRDILSGNIALLYQLGVNSMVLCDGCNQGKKAKQFVPPGAGYAYKRHAEDKNPDHRYAGPPQISWHEKRYHPE